MQLNDMRKILFASNYIATTTQLSANNYLRQ